MTATAMPIHVLDADSTRADIEEALGHVLREMRRAPHVTARPGCPATRWDSLNRFADELLTMWQAAE